MGSKVLGGSSLVDEAGGGAAATTRAVGGGVEIPSSLAGGEQQHPRLPAAPVNSRQSSFGRRADVWGWLAPAPGARLPYVLLQDGGVAIGRGRDEYLERLPCHPASAMPASTADGSGGLAVDTTSGSGGLWPRLSLGSMTMTASGSGGGVLRSLSGGRQGSGGLPPSLAVPSGSASALPFVEIADGRISRVHCLIKFDAGRQRAELEVSAWALSGLEWCDVTLSTCF